MGYMLQTVAILAIIIFLLGNLMSKTNNSGNSSLIGQQDALANTTAKAINPEATITNIFGTRYGKHIGSGKGRIYKDSSNNLYHVTDNLNPPKSSINLKVYKSTFSVPYVYEYITINPQNPETPIVTNRRMVITSDLKVYESPSSNELIFSMINTNNGTLSDIKGFYCRNTTFVYQTDQDFPNIYIYTDPTNNNSKIYLYAQDLTTCYGSTDKYRFNGINLITMTNLNPAPTPLYIIKGKGFFDKNYTTAASPNANQIKMNSSSVGFSTSYLYVSTVNAKLYLNLKSDSNGLYFMSEINSPSNPTNTTIANSIPVFKAEPFEFRYGISNFDSTTKMHYGFYRNTSTEIAGTTKYLFIPPQSNSSGNENWRFSTDGINFKLITDIITGEIDDLNSVKAETLDPFPISWNTLFGPNESGKNIGNRGTITQNARTQEIKFEEMNPDAMSITVTLDTPFDYNFYPDLNNFSTSEIQKMVITSTSLVYYSENNGTSYNRINLISGNPILSPIYYFNNATKTFSTTPPL